MQKYFEIIIFTAGVKQYADVIIDQIDPNKQYINYILSREYCLEVDTNYVKDLRILKNRKIENMIIIDNWVHSFENQIDNGIQILEWEGDMNDKELIYIQNYLIEISRCENITEFNGNTLKLRELIGNNDILDRKNN